MVTTREESNFAVILFRLVPRVEYALDLPLDFHTYPDRLLQCGSISSLLTARRAWKHS